MCDVPVWMISDEPDGRGDVLVGQVTVHHTDQEKPTTAHHRTTAGNPQPKSLHSRTILGNVVHEVKYRPHVPLATGS